MRYDSGMKNFRSKSLGETANVAQEWLAKISQDRGAAALSTGAFVVGLSGHLGAGKTAFVKAVAHELGVVETVTSPTFVLMKIYEVSGTKNRESGESGSKGSTKNKSFKRLVHIDAYRLERREELEALRFEDVVADSGNLVMIEWPENVGLTTGVGDDVGGQDHSSGLHEWLKFEIKDGVYTISVK